MQEDAIRSSPLSEIFHKDGGKREVDGDARDVVRRRHERPGRNGRIDTRPLQDNRHERGHASGNEERNDERDSYDHAEKTLMPDPTDQRQYDPAGHAHQQADLHLAEKDVPDVGHLDHPGRESTDDERGRLKSDVAAHGGDHGNETHDGDDFLDRIAKLPEDGTRKQAADEVGEQPRQPYFGRRNARGLRDRLLFHGARHLQHVFGGFFPDHVYDIVDRNNADQHTVFVHNWNGEEIVTGDLTRHLLLVHVHGDTDDFAGGNILERGGGRHRQELTQRQDSHKMIVLVGDIDVEHHFSVRRLL